MKGSAWCVSTGLVCMSDPFKMSVEQASSSGAVNDTVEDDKTHLIKGLMYFDSICNHCYEYAQALWVIFWRHSWSSNLVILKLILVWLVTKYWIRNLLNVIWCMMTSMVNIRYILHFWHFWFACSDVVFVNRSLFESNLFSELVNEPCLNGSFRNRTESVRAILESTTYWTENRLFWDKPWILMFKWKDALIDKQQKCYYWKCARWLGFYREFY